MVSRALLLPVATLLMLDKVVLIPGGVSNLVSNFGIVHAVIGLLPTFAVYGFFVIS